MSRKILMIFTVTGTVFLLAGAGFAQGYNPNLGYNNAIVTRAIAYSKAKAAYNKAKGKKGAAAKGASAKRAAPVRRKASSGKVQSSNVQSVSGKPKVDAAAERLNRMNAVTGNSSVLFHFYPYFTDKNKAGKIILDFTPVGGRGTAFSRTFLYDNDRDIRSWKLDKLPRGEYTVTGTAFYGNESAPLYMYNVGDSEKTASTRLSFKAEMPDVDFIPTELTVSTSAIYVNIGKPKDMFGKYYF